MHESTSKLVRVGFEPKKAYARGSSFFQRIRIETMRKREKEWRMNRMAKCFVGLIFNLQI